ncbi:MAG: hypothetical protein L0H79_07235 [Intrasporangium sp.]|nr:hypothetical protein [Intrasporangium sp.]MDN5795532.1 hypothetical protein [Intrasporangium sp.]
MSTLFDDLFGADPTAKAGAAAGTGRAMRGRGTDVTDQGGPTWAEATVRW